MSASRDNSDNFAPASISQNARSKPLVRSGMLRPSLFSPPLTLLIAEEEVKYDVSNAGDTRINVFSNDIGLAEEGTATCTTSDKNKEKCDPLSLLTKNGIPKSNLLVTTKTSIPLEDKAGFVFGQNVHERVVGESIQTASKSNNCTSIEDGSSEPSSSTSSNLLFSSAFQNTKSVEDGTTLKTETDIKSLTEVAREYEESRAQKRKYDEVETFTGEEDEINILDLNCKLFAFVDGNWEERGRGSLRLNDSKESGGCARVVFRTSGNLRLLLNTKIWPEMVAQRPSQKSLRITAMDNNGQIKIFLIMSRPADINIIFNALVGRINLLKSSANDESQNNGSAINLKDIENSGEPVPKKTVSGNN